MKNENSMQKKNSATILKDKADRVKERAFHIL